MDELFRNYWHDALSIVTRQFASATEACQAAEAPYVPTRQTMRTVSDHLRRPRREVPGGADEDEATQGHLIRLNEPSFARALEWLQQELRELVDALPRDDFEKEYEAVVRVLNLSPEDMKEYFGTLTEGWDKLVTLKQELLLPDPLAAHWSAWFVSLMADFERALRDTVCLAIQHLGHIEPVKGAIVESSRELGIEGSSMAKTLSWDKTEFVIADTFSDFMIGGVDQTVSLAMSFCKALPVRPTSFASYTDGFCPKLDELGNDTLTIIRELVGWQHEMLHDSSLLNRPARSIRPGPSPSLLKTASSEYKKMLVQFLYGFSIQVALAIMDTISTNLGKPNSNLSVETCADARYKTAAELRVSDLSLLTHELWWLAWTVAESIWAFEYEEPSKLMLRFNAIYAQKKLGIIGWKDQLEDIDVSASAVRYQLLKDTLQQRWKGIEAKVRKALMSEDMTSIELETWPALEELRSRGTIVKVIRQLESGG